MIREHSTHASLLSVVLFCGSACIPEDVSVVVHTVGDHVEPRGVSARSHLPIPPGPIDVPKPTGSAAKLVVLPWAGFTSAASYTFDDSQPSQIEHYADLQSAGVPMTFYVSTGGSNQPNYDATWTKAVADGHEIGNHSVHHCHADLTGCPSGAPLASLDLELDESTSYIRAHTPQKDVWTGASPFGDTGYDVAAQSRFFLYRGAAPGTIGPNDATDPFNLPCHAVAADETEARFDAVVDGAHANGQWVILLIHTIQPTTANWFAPVQIADVVGSMQHGKSLGDMWLGTVASIGAYWRGQKIFSSVAPTSAGGQQTWTWKLPAHFPSGSYLRVSGVGGTLTQNSASVPWDGHGYYEIALDAGALTWSP